MKKRRHPIPDVAGSFPATLALDRQLHEILAVPDRLDQRQREERKPGLLPGMALVALTPTGTAAKGHVGQAAQAENREQPLQDPVADQNHLAVVAKTASRKPPFSWRRCLSSQHRIGQSGPWRSQEASQGRKHEDYPDSLSPWRHILGWRHRLTYSLDWTCSGTHQPFAGQSRSIQGYCRPPG